MASKTAGLASESSETVEGNKKGFVATGGGGGATEISFAGSSIPCVLTSAVWAKGLDGLSASMWQGMASDSVERNGLDGSEMDVMCGNGADVDPANGLVAVGVLSSSRRSPKNAESQRGTPPGASPATTHADSHTFARRVTMVVPGSE